MVVVRTNMFNILGTICVGDKTSCGGTVSTGAVSATVNGKSIARVGDKIACKKNCVIVTGDETKRIGGAAMAFHGSQTSEHCTCFSSNNDYHGIGQHQAAVSRVPTAADAGIAFMPDTAKLLNEDHWIEFQLIDARKQPVPDQPFIVVDPSGVRIAGSLDEKGFARISPVKAGQCTVHFPELGQSITVDACKP